MVPICNRHRHSREPTQECRVGEHNSRNMYILLGVSQHVRMPGPLEAKFEADDLSLDHTTKRVNSTTGQSFVRGADVERAQAILFKGFIADLGINVVCGTMDSGSSNAMSAELQSPAPSKRQRLRNELRSWSASSGQDFSCAETSKQQYSLIRRPSLFCIVCKTEIRCTPVYQCETGHLACKLCALGGSSCSSCSKAISCIKNVAIGQFIKSLGVSCKFAKLGCKAEIAFTAPRSKHESICRFSPVNCPMPGCKQAGVKNDLSEHFLEKHGVNSAVDIEIEGYDRYATWHRAIFDLDSSLSLVLLAHTPSGEFYLLHQEHTAFGDRLQVTSMVTEESPTRKYELTVDVSNEETYCYKSLSTSNLERQGGLLIPKMPGNDPAAKKRCNIRMLQRRGEQRFNLIESDEV